MEHVTRAPAQLLTQWPADVYLFDSGWPRSKNVLPNVDNQEAKVYYQMWTKHVTDISFNGIKWNIFLIALRHTHTLLDKQTLNWRREGLAVELGWSVFSYFHALYEEKKKSDTQRPDRLFLFSSGEQGQTKGQQARHRHWLPQREVCGRNSELLRASHCLLTWWLSPFYFQQPCNWNFVMNWDLKKNPNKILGSVWKHFCAIQLLNTHKVAYALIIKIFDTKVFYFC